jgi:hypothetical protein
VRQCESSWRVELNPDFCALKYCAENDRVY